MRYPHLDTHIYEISKDTGSPSDPFASYVCQIRDHHMHESYV